MDAVRFIEDFGHICSHYDCQECPLYNEPCDLVGTSQEEAEEIVAIVEQWSNEHPRMNNWQKFKEVFGIDISNLFIVSQDELSPVGKPFTNNWANQEYKAPEEGA